MVDWSEAGVLSQGDNVGPALADCCQINLDLTLPHFFKKKTYTKICMQNFSILRTLNAKNKK